MFCQTQIILLDTSWKTIYFQKKAQTFQYIYTLNHALNIPKMTTKTPATKTNPKCYVLALQSCNGKSFSIHGLWPTPPTKIQTKLPCKLDIISIKKLWKLHTVLPAKLLRQYHTRTVLRNSSEF